jgi:hypothetical protein
MIRMSARAGRAPVAARGWLVLEVVTKGRRTGVNTRTYEFEWDHDVTQPLQVNYGFFIFVFCHSSGAIRLQTILLNNAEIYRSQKRLTPLHCLVHKVS